MAYEIRLTDGTIFATVAESTTNIDSSITLIGKNVADYGIILNENYMRLLESHAEIDANKPSAPLTGQLWFDKDTSTLKVWDGGLFKNLGSATPATSEPTAINSTLGDIWFNTVTEQTYIFNDTEYVLIGPVSSTADNSGPVVVTVSDGAIDHIIVQHLVNGVIVGITSSDAEFTPVPAITGFTSIKPGYNLLSTAVFNGTATQADNATLAATATNALSLGNVLAADYLRSDVNDTHDAGLTITTTLDVGTSIAINSDAGLTLGTGSDLAVTVTGTGTAEIRNVTNNQLVEFWINNATTDTKVLWMGGGSTVQVNDSSGGGKDVVNVDYLGTRLTTLDDANLSLDGSDTMGSGAQIKADNGTAALPGISFGSDLNTGMYRSAADELTIVTGGSASLTIVNNGPLNVSGIAIYETLVTGDDDIPNKKYVDDEITAAKEFAYPCFRAYRSTSYFAFNSVVQIDTETFDATADYSTSTYRFTPQVSGIYLVTASCKILSYPNSAQFGALSIRKNGGIYAQSGEWSNTTGDEASYVITTLVEFNGTTDYVDLYSGANINVGGGPAGTWFQAHRIQPLP